METTTTRIAFSDNVDWDEALSDFLLQTRTSREEGTERFYQQRVGMLRRWAAEKAIPLTEFRARHMREYLASRQGAVSETTRRLDAVAARTFFKFCKREEYIPTNPLAEYQIPKAERPYVKCPSDDEIRSLLQAVNDRYKEGLNPKAKYIRAEGKRFFAKRNYAVLAGLVETAARIGEMLALRLDDYQPAQRQIVIRKSKGDEPRTIPISDWWVQAVDSYLRARPKVESNLLFINEFGDPLTTGQFRKAFREYQKFAGVDGFTLHGLRHYALTQLAKTDLWAANQIAGHKDLTVTRRYLHGDVAHVREAHAQAAPLGRILGGNDRKIMERRRRVV